MQKNKGKYEIMTKNYELELVKELIKDGYDNLEAISFELDIPMIVLQKMKVQIEREKVKSHETRLNAWSKLQSIRSNYDIIFYGDDSQALASHEEERVNPKVEVAISKIQDAQGITDSVKRAFAIVKILKEIENQELSYSQVERITATLYDKKVFFVHYSEPNKAIIRLITKYKQRYISKFTQSLSKKLNETTNIQELKNIKALLTYDMEQEFTVIVSPLKMKINAKISKLSRQETINNIELNFSDKMRLIASKLTSNGASAKSIIQDVNDEVQKRIEQTKNNKFALSQDNQKRQVFYQLGMILKKKASEYKIEDEDKTLKILQEIFSTDLESNLRLIVNNYIARKEYKKAYSVCDKYSKSIDEHGNTSKSIRTLKSNIKSAEIGDIILKGIKCNASDEEMEKFYQIISNGIEKYGLKPSSIPLGNNQKGTREITLADVIKDQKQSRNL